MTSDEGFTTPEGHWLPRAILLPDVRSFDEVLTYVREWDYDGMRDGTVPRPAPALIDENEIGPYCTVNARGDRYRGIAVQARQNVLDVVAPRIVTPDDHLSFEIIEHKDRNRALVILSHNYIIGSHWLAYIDPATIPARPEKG
jgi:hypothetical protein